MNSENRNFILAIVLSMIVWVGYSMMIEKPPVTAKNVASSGPVELPVQPLKKILSKEEALSGDLRIAINTPKLKGSISLKGARFDDLELKEYKQDTKEGSPCVVLLSPSNTANGYLIESGWMGEHLSSFPGPNTIWKSSSSELSVGKPVTLSWVSPEGVLFERIIEIDDKYMFKITEKVNNSTSSDIVASNWAVISRVGLPATSDYMVLHEGAIGMVNGKLKEIEYKKLKEKPMEENNASGWIGFTDKYWLTSLIPQDKMKVNAKFKVVSDSGVDVYQAEYTTPQTIIKSGQTYQTIHHVFAGAKILNMLDAYEVTHNLDHFDLAVDFGWFYFLTKPLFHAMSFLYGFLGNFGWAIVVLTILAKAIMFPFANKSYRSMSRMKILQPEMERLKQKYGEDKVRMQQELMAFYKANNLNPLGGCLPMLIQIPVFFALYKVLFVSIEMRHAPFFGWIHDLSAPDPTSIFNLFGLLSFTPPGALMIGVWPLIMAFTMYLQQKMSPQPADSTQAKMMLLMPLLMLYLFASFPAGLVIYWAWSNVLSILQQWVQSRTVVKGA